MRRITIVYIGLGTFLACWVLLFVLPCFDLGCPIKELARLTDGMVANFLLLVLIFAASAAAVALAADFLYRRLRRFRPFRPKLGEILVQRGFITADQLETALAIQQMRIGELLHHLGYLNEAQLQEALRLQREGMRKRLGEIVAELGYASAHDVQRAAGRVHQKLGRILIDMGLVGKDEVRAVLGRQWYGRRRGF